MTTDIGLVLLMFGPCILVRTVCAASCLLDPHGSVWERVRAVRAPRSPGVGPLSFEHVLAPSSVCGALCQPGEGCWISRASGGVAL